MKKILFLIISVLTFSGHAQIFDPVKWETSVEKIGDNEYDLVVKATIDAGWHVYSLSVPEGGPVATSFSYKDIEGQIKLIGETTESEGEEVYDEVFQMNIKSFENEAIFKQRIKTLTNKAFSLKEYLEFMVCDDSNCLPPTEVEITFDINPDATVLKPTAAVDFSQTNAQKEAQSHQPTVTKDQGQLKKKSLDQQAKQEKKQGLWTLFVLSFLAGFAALLTPCVFPMIPMTVSFFTKQSKTRAQGIKNAIFYGLAIIVLYVLLGTVVTSIFGADSLNALSTNVWFNLIFFALLIVFAVSFLGAFEITLPSSWSTKVDAQADRGGLIGIIFMALALAVVSFSCTGPIVGTALVAAASKGGIAPIISMLGFSLAIALPFTLFAAFPGWLNSLPKSGGWLNTVKVVLGFLELALAFKFLSNADLVLQLHWLEREVFLAIWITIFGALAFYLFGKIKLPHDSEITHLSVGRLSLGLFVMAFTIYLIPGLWGAPLKLISGFPPPMHYSESTHGVGYTKLSDGSLSASITLPKGAKFGPHDIITFTDYNTGMAYAKKVNKPVLLDFTGHACVNCRKMEERVWSDPKVLSILKNDIVLISLYVDEKTPLPTNQQYTSEVTGKKIKTIGNKWSEFQIIKYKANAQPYYVLLDHQGENLNRYIAYDPDIENYLSWLNEGIANFNP